MFVSGATVSTVHVREAGDASVLPAASVGAHLERVRALRRGRCSWRGTSPNAAPSSAHWNVEPASVAVKVKVALVLLTEPVGPAVMVVSGATVSTVHVREAGEASVLPAASVARTWKVCDALREAGVPGRARAEGGAVERALERRARFGRGEGERGAGAADRAGADRC